MSNQQLYVAIGLPILFNGMLIAVLTGYINSRFSLIEKRFDHIDRRFDDMRDLWRAELHRLAHH